MTGVLWAAVAGVAYGVFQAVNRGTLVDMDVLESTFLQLLVSSLVLVALVLGLHGAAPGQIPAAAVLYFGLAGLVHFLGGWTLLNRSQQLLGAARTSPLLASVPLFGTVLALAVLREVPSVAAVARHDDDRRRRLRGAARPRAAPGACGGERRRAAGRAEAGGGRWRRRASVSGAALCWSVSPVFIRRGLDAMDAPMVGVTLGLIAATLAYGVLLAVAPPRPLARGAGPRDGAGRSWPACWWGSRRGPAGTPCRSTP